MIRLLFASLFLTLSASVVVAQDPCGCRFFPANLTSFNVAKDQTFDVTVSAPPPTGTESAALQFQVWNTDQPVEITLTVNGTVLRAFLEDGRDAGKYRPVSVPFPKVLQGQSQLRISIDVRQPLTMAHLGLAYLPLGGR